MILSMNGLTLREVLNYLQQIPEDQLDEGELWIGDGAGLSKPCTIMWPLNKREHSQDILVE